MVEMDRMYHEKLQAGDGSNLGYFYARFLDSSDAVRAYCADAITQYVTQSRVDEIIVSAGNFRQFWWDKSYNDAELFSKAFENVTEIHQRFALLALGTFHANGFFREKCIDNLTVYGPRALPFVMLQVNNWVPVIREKAFVIVHNMLPQASAQELIACFPAFQKIKLGQRRDDKVQRQLYNQLKQCVTAQSEQVSTAFLLSCFPRVRRFYYEIIGVEKHSESWWLALLSQDTDSFNKLVIARSLLGYKNLSENAKRKLLNFPIGSIRYAAIKRFYRDGAAWHNAKEYLLDKSRAIRQFARFYLRQHSSMDFVAFYEQCLNENPTIMALLGLIETSNKTHAPYVREFLASPSPVFVKTAIYGLGVLQGSDEANTYYAYILHSNRVFAKAAFDVIKHLYIRFPAKQCFEDLNTEQYEHSQKYLLRMILMATAWEQLPYLILLSSHLNGHIRQLAKEGLQNWKANFVPPTQETLTLLQDVIAKQPWPLSKKHRKEMLFQLEPYVQI